jgi:hypothetical protein
MTQKSLTPDEKFLLNLYQTAFQTGDLFQEIDACIVAKAVSLKETALKNIVKHLAQANFVIKGSDPMIQLTPHGCKFIEEHL